jgi:diketogulonate reductase-like aldo/keto reductase
MGRDLKGLAAAVALIRTCTLQIELANVPYRETWEAMEALVDKGLARNIGVSNVTCQQLMDILKYARIRPQVNQVWPDPRVTVTRLLCDP